MRRLLDWLEERVGRFAVPHMTLVVIVAQALAFSATMQPGADWSEALAPIALIPAKVLQGEAWRLITFVAVPPHISPVFLIFAWYLFYLMGTALEHHWGTFRFNLFLLSGWAATVAASFLRPQEEAHATFLAGSVFLAYAHLNPSFVIYLLFIVPIEIRWLALLTWVGYGFLVVFGDWVTRVTVLAAVLNFLLFFGPEVLWGMFDSARRMARRASLRQAEPTPPVPQKQERRCEVCGLTSTLDPSMEFRYCSRCEGMHSFCKRHIRDHEHFTATRASGDA
jgi:membrane associated rhomboid family serine protease